MDIDFSSRESTMKDVVSRCLEDITFSIVEPFINQNINSDVDTIESFLSISFNASDVIMKISVDATYLDSVITTLFPDTTDNSIHYEDTIDEITNTIGGTFFRRLEPELGTFNISVPYHSAAGKYAKLASFKFLVDDLHVIEITLMK